MTFAVAANEKGEKVLTMSKEYIEREKALEKVIEVKHHDPELSGVVLHRYIKEIDLKDIPAADVAPVRYGRWEKRGSKWQCTNCKVLMSIDGTPQENLLYYCPNCGAKMDKEAKEE